MAINSINSVTPPYLQKGDVVEIIAPAKFVSNKDIDDAIQIIEKSGFKIKISQSLFNQHHVFSGTIKERKNNLQSALDNPETKAIIFARGGYGSIQIIDQIDFTIFAKKPKWLIGFSDITTILLHIQTRYNIQSIHGPMLYNFPKTGSIYISQLFHILKGDVNNIESTTHKLNKFGTHEGKLIGGNLSILCSLMCSSSFNTISHDVILFLEDVDEYLYHIERMIHTLDRSGLLKNLKGLIVGEMANMLDNEIPFGKNVYELIYDITKKYDYPICFNFPIGHSHNNHPIVLGSHITLDVKENYSKIIYKR